MASNSPSTLGGKPAMNTHARFRWSDVLNDKGLLRTRPAFGRLSGMFFDPLPSAAHGGGTFPSTSTSKLSVSSGFTPMDQGHRVAAWFSVIVADQTIAK